MSALLPSWLAGLGGFEGLFGMGVAQPGKEPEFRSWAAPFSVAELTTLWRQAGDVVEVLQAEKLPSQKLRWMFDRAVIYFERRRDGATLLLVTAPEPWAGEGEAVSALMSQFRELA